MSPNRFNRHAQAGAFGLCGADGAYPQAPTNITPPSLARDGAQLTSDSGDWTGDPTSYTYEWHRGSELLSTDPPPRTCAQLGAVQGDAITLTIRASNSAGQSAPVTSAPHTCASLAVSTTSPTLTGPTSPLVGEQITCSDGTWENSTGIAKQWQRGVSNQDISGATGDTYTVTEDDATIPLRCVVTAADEAGFTTTAESSNTLTPAPLGAPSIDSVTISGGTTVGEQLTCSASVNHYGNPPASPSYQWRESGADISGSTSDTHTPSAAGTYTCVVTLSNSAGTHSSESNSISQS